MCTLSEMIKKNEEYELFKLYIAESLKAHGEGKALTISYNDLINPKPEDNRTAEEIIEEVSKKSGIKVVYS